MTVHDDEALWFGWHRTDESVPPRWIEGITAVPPERERLLMASRREWTMPLPRAALAAGRRLVLLPGHDGLLLPLLAEAFVDTHPGGRALVVLSKRVFQRLQDAGRLPDCVELTTSEGLRGNEDPVVLEPFAAAADPWSLIADTAKRLAPFTNVAFPSAASVMAVLVECQGTWLARQPLAKVSGSLRIGYSFSSSFSEKVLCLTALFDVLAAENHKTLSERAAPAHWESETHREVRYTLHAERE